jgi:dihydrofolate reductase
MNFSIIAAIDLNFGIGKDGQLLAHLPEDLKRFKKITIGHTVIMGRKTFESLPNGPLPGRKNIILSTKLEAVKNAIICPNLHCVFEHCDKQNENFIIGGSQIYKLFLPFVDKFYLTIIQHVFEADSFFPKINFANYQKVCFSYHRRDSKNKYDFSFVILKK